MVDERRYPYGDPTIAPRPATLDRQQYTNPLREEGDRGLEQLKGDPYSIDAQHQWFKTNQVTANTPEFRARVQGLPFRTQNREQQIRSAKQHAKGARDAREREGVLRKQFMREDALYQDALQNAYRGADLSRLQSGKSYDANRLAELQARAGLIQQNLGNASYQRLGDIKGEQDRLDTMLDDIYRNRQITEEVGQRDRLRAQLGAKHMADKYGVHPKNLESMLLGQGVGRTADEAVSNLGIDYSTFERQQEEAARQAADLKSEDLSKKALEFGGLNSEDKEEVSLMKQAQRQLELSGVKNPSNTQKLLAKLLLEQNSVGYLGGEESTPPFDLQYNPNQPGFWSNLLRAGANIGEGIATGGASGAAVGGIGGLMTGGALAAPAAGVGAVLGGIGGGLYNIPDAFRSFYQEKFTSPSTDETYYLDVPDNLKKLLAVESKY